MVRLYDVTSGSITLNGVDVRCAIACIGFIRQPQLYHASLVCCTVMSVCPMGGDQPIRSVCGVSICRELRQGALRGCVAVVPQDTVLFNDTIYRNIAYGRWEVVRSEFSAATRGAPVTPCCVHVAHFAQPVDAAFLSATTQ